MRSTISILAVAGVLGGLAACDHDAVQGVEPLPLQPLTPAVGSLVTALCDLTFRCCDPGEVSYAFGPYVQPANCDDRLMGAASLESAILFQLDLAEPLAVLLPNLGALELAHEEERGTIDTGALAACLDYLAGLGCKRPDPEPVEGCVPLEPEPEPTPCNVDLLFVGTVPQGGTCSSPGTSYECAEGLGCRTTDPLGVMGRCVPVGQQGDLCFDDDECDQELVCTLLDGTCQPLRKEGESCVYSDRDDPSPSPGTLLWGCESHLACDPVTDTCVQYCERGAPCYVDESCNTEAELSCILGRCDLLRGLGLPCGADDDCADERVCSYDPAFPESLVCVDRRADGELCVLHSQCLSGFCDPVTDRCAATEAAGDPCPTGLDEQCGQGLCVREEVACVDETDCPITGTCDPYYHWCGTYCVELKPDGATCVLDEECISEACVAGFCRTPPLPDGEPCDTDLDCESEFCGLEDERVCTELPLGLGARCWAGAQCESLVCFALSEEVQPTCINGLGEGEACGDPELPPCNPHRFHCEVEEEPQVCLPLHETGEPCDYEAQCRGSCVLRLGRMMCSPQAPDGEAVCDGLPVAEQ